MRILGDGKFEDFHGFSETGKKNCSRIVFESGNFLECSHNHAVKLKLNQEWSLVRELNIGDVLLGGEKIKDIVNIGKKYTYSPMNVGSSFSYYCNGTISHNCAFIEGYDEFFASVYPTISSGNTSKLLMTSTPNGLNHFYKTCKGAKEGTNGYEYVEVMWYDVPGRDEKWKEETLQSLDYDMEKFKQEYCCEFAGSSGTLISGEKLKSLVYKTPINESEGLKQYCNPKIGHTYTIICDVSRGKGLDYSAFSVIDITEMPYQQVCTFRDNFVGPVDYANIIYRIAKNYNDAQVLIEINDIGGQVADTLWMDFGYEDMLFTESAGRSGKRISGGFGNKVDKGIRTTKSVKSIGCSILKLLIEQEQLIINDFNTVEELSRFSRKGSSYEAESGHHDDLVMTLVLFSWLSDQTFFKDLTDINTMMKLREKTEDQIEEELLPFGFMDDGSSEDSDTSWL